MIDLDISTNPEISPKEYIEEVDDRFSDCLNRGLDSGSELWVTFSAVINRRLRKKIQSIEESHPFAKQLKWCFAYWVHAGSFLNDLQEPFINMKELDKKKQDLLMIREFALGTKSSEGYNYPIEINGKTFTI
jgi:hypothetical protein